MLARETASKPVLTAWGTVLASRQLEEDGRGLRPDWTINYAGAENFWDDEWKYHGEIEASNVAGVLDVTEECDFLAKDPEKVDDLDGMLKFPSLLPGIAVSNPLARTTDQEDCFCRFPEEILLQTIASLPSPSVQAIRVASKAMAEVSLSSGFWRSRFDFPNELCHIPLPYRFKSGPIDGSPIGWKSLCMRLLASGDRSQNLQNRRKISELTDKLAIRILFDRNPRAGNHGEGDHLPKDLFCSHSLFIPNQRKATSASVVFGDSKNFRCFSAGF